MADRAVIVPQAVDAWLDAVADLPESALPLNVSTVAYAVNTAKLYREAYRRMLALVREMSSGSQNVDMSAPSESAVSSADEPPDDVPIGP